MELEAPDQAVAGSLVPVRWTAENPQPSDLVTIVSAGERWRTGDGKERVHDRRRADVTAPGRAGDHEVLYVSSATGETAARRPLTLTEPATSVTAPETVTAGSDLRVTWSENIHPEDYVTLVPVGAPDAEYDDYVKVRDDSEGTLTAPGEPGEYEAGYVLREDRSVLARVPVTVVEAQASVTAPEEVTAGSDFRVTWDPSVHPKDYVTLVPVDAPGEEYHDYVRVRDDKEGTLTAPSTPGEYQARYVLRENRTVLARAPVTVSPAQSQVTAPERVTAGAEFTVGWDTAVHSKDYITIVPADAAASEYGDYTRATDDHEGSLVAPATAGAHEVRYVLRQDRVVLSRVPVEVVLPEVSIEGPATVAPQETFDVQWDAAVHRRGYVTIVPADAAPDEYGDYVNVGSKLAGRLTAPETPGAYEVRYVLREGRTPVGRLSVRVEEATE